MLKLRKNNAVFTIVKNEKYFFPIWLRYYSQHFSDIFVLDHNTTDGSIIDGAFIKVPLHHKFAWDHHWMRKTVSEYQQYLLRQYRTVLFTEVDEIIIPDPKYYQDLQSYIQSMQHSCISTNSFNVYHNKRLEKTIDINEGIFRQRKYVKKLPSQWGKPLLSKIPLSWSIGFHHCDEPVNFDENLYLFHLRFMDAKIFFSRLAERTIGQKIKNDGFGIRNAMGKQEILHYKHYNLSENLRDDSDNRTFEKIPSRFYNLL